MEINEIYPKFCKNDSCFKPAEYQFTDYKDGKTITLGYSCQEHLVENQKMFKEISESKKERGKNGSR